MPNQKRPLSEHQLRIKLLAHLGFVPGKSMGEGQSLVNWHFGTRGVLLIKGQDGVSREYSRPLPGKNPLHVPSRSIAKWLAFYAPSKMVDNALRTSLVREFNLDQR